MKTLILIIPLAMFFLSCGKNNKIEHKNNLPSKSAPTTKTNKDKVPEWFLLKTKNRCYENLNKAHLISLIGKSDGC
jgi:ribosomal protein L39E